MKPHLSTRNNFGQWLNELGLVGEGAEIGVAFGGFSAIILGQWKGRMLHMVDLWAKQPAEDYKEGTNEAPFPFWHEQAVRVVRESGHACLHKGYSTAISQEFPDGSLDFVYIDANHGYDWVLADMDEWWPKVKHGGVICGHDYYDDCIPPKHCEVKRAVQDWVRRFVAPKLEICTTTEDTDPTWYIFKP